MFRSSLPFVLIAACLSIIASQPAHADTKVLTAEAFWNSRSRGL